MGHSTFYRKTAIITGASSGIGRSVAVAFAREGARISIAARREDELRRVEQQVQEYKSEVLLRRTDVTARDQVQSLVRDTQQRYGRIDILVCSAGQYIRGAVRDLDTEEFERSMAVNFYGALHCIKEVLPLMLAQRSGHIVVISSVDGKKGLPLDAPYVAAKFALNGYMDVLRQELYGTGVQALTILPGRVDTPMIDHLNVPLVSRKISSDRVARTVLRGIRRGKAEMIVPLFGPTGLVWANAVSPRLADWLVRLFRLEGTVMVPGERAGGVA